MRLPSTAFRSLGSVVALLLTASSAVGDGIVRPVVTWSGTIADAKLEKYKPKSRVITERNEFVTLWKEWELGEPIPSVAFDRYFVLVVTAAERRIFVIQLNIGKDGDAKTISRRDNDQIEGFGYGLAVFPRANLTTVHGVNVREKVGRRFRPPDTLPDETRVASHRPVEW